MDKIRKKYIELRKNISPIQRKIAEKRIFELIKNHPIVQNEKNIMIYISTKYEVATDEIIKYFFKKLKNVYVPVIKNKEIKIVKIDEKTIFIENKYGIKEPLKERKYINCRVLDVVFVPGVCFTKNGERLGRGGGYYDKFLKKISNDSVKIIGICYDNQLALKIPQNENDVQVDEIIYNLKAK